MDAPSADAAPAGPLLQEGEWEEHTARPARSAPRSMPAPPARSPHKAPPPPTRKARAAGAPATRAPQEFAEAIPAGNTLPGGAVQRPAARSTGEVPPSTRGRFSCGLSSYAGLGYGQRADSPDW